MGKKRPLKTVALAVDEKAKAIKSSGVKLRAGGGLHELEIPGWSAGDMEKQPGNEMNNNNKMKNNNNKMKIKNEMKNKNE